LVLFFIFKKNFIKKTKKPHTADALYLNEGLEINSNSLRIHVYCSFTIQYFNIKKSFLSPLSFPRPLPCHLHSFTFCNESING
jgi:hypothetical protein